MCGPRRQPDSEACVPPWVKQRKMGLGLPGVGSEMWEGEEKECMLNKGCLVQQVKLSQMIRVVS